MCTGLTLTQDLPRLPAMYGESDRLDDDALVPGGECLERQLLGGIRVVRDDAGHPPFAGDPGEFGEAHGERLIDEIASVDVQQVEEPWAQDEFAGDVGAEPRHGLLERPRPTVLIEREGLAVEDQVARGETAHDLDDLGHPMGDVGEAASEDADLITVSMDLDPRAVELVLDGRCTGDLESRSGRRSVRREHRQHRSADDQTDIVELLGGAGEREKRGLPEIPGEHRRAPDGSGGAPGGPDDRIQQHASERTRAQFAEHGAGEEIPLLRRRARSEIRQLSVPRGRGAGSGCRGQNGQGDVDVGDAQRRGIRMDDLEGRDPAPADAEPALTRTREQQPGEGEDLVGGRALEQPREGFDLRQSRRRGRDFLCRGDGVREHHPRILAPAADVGEGAGSRSVETPAPKRPFSA